MVPKQVLSVVLIALMVTGVFIGCLDIGKAESITKPSIPEFTLNYTVQSKDVPGTTPTYTTNPYTGQQEIQTPGTPGYHQDLRVIEIKVKNQPFTAYVDGSNYIALYYNVSYKGYYENDWHYYSRVEQSSSGYTLINFTEVPNDGGTMEFRVQAKIGYYTEYHMPFVDHYFTGQTSDWSNTQTINIPASSTVSPTPTTEPSIAPTGTSNPTVLVFDSSLAWLVVGIVVGLVVIVAILVVIVALMRRRISVLEKQR